MAGRSRSLRLPPEVNRIIYVRNLPFKITAEEMYDLFGRYGALRQVRLGDAPETKGSAFVVFEDIFDAKNACEHLSGFNVGGRYLVCLYYKPAHSTKAVTLAQQQEEVLIMRARVAAGEAAAAAAAAAASAGGGDAGDESLDDEADKRLMRR